MQGDLEKLLGGPLFTLPVPIGLYVPSQGPCQFPYLHVSGMLAHVLWTLWLTSCLNALRPQLLVVSDLFTERTQFEMMYLTLTELRRAHPAEDEILIQYLVPATCKAAAVLGMVSPRRCGGHLVLAACCGCREPRPWKA